MNARRWPLVAATALLGVSGLGVPGGLAAHAPQEDVLFGRVEIREAPSAWLGVKFRHVVTHDSARVVLASVFPNSPAARAGLESGDRLLRVNGKAATMGLMSSLAPRIEAGDPFTFTVLRGTDVREASLVAEPRPESGDIIVSRVQTQLDTLRKLIAVSLDSLERSGLVGLPSLEVRRVDGSDGSVTLVVSTEAGSVTLEAGAVTLSEAVGADAGSAWPDIQHFATARVRADSAHEGPKLPPAPWTGEASPAEPGRLEVRVRTSADHLPAVDVDGWSITGSLSPWEEGARRVAGAELHEVGPDLGRYLGIDRGLMVAEVTPGTPAALAGLQPGDVLLSVDDVTLDSVSEFREIMSVPSRERSLAVVRQGTGIELTLRR